MVALKKISTDKVKAVTIHFVNGKSKSYSVEKVVFEIIENGILIYDREANMIVFHPFSGILGIEFLSR